MANSARNLPGSEPKSSRQEENPLDGVMGFYETNKKMINTVTTVVLVVVVGYFAYTKLVKGPAEEKASAALALPLNYFAADSINMALNGFQKVSKKYGGTAAGNLAHYYEGVCYLKTGDYKNAIKELKEFDGKGTLVAANAEGLLGEAYMESGDNAKAIDCFKKATADKDDIMVTPMYLYQLGLAYEATNNAAEAKATFKRIRDEYPKSTQARDTEKELARLGDLE